MKISWFLILLTLNFSFIEFANANNIFEQLQTVYPKNLRLRKFEPANIITTDSNILNSSIKVDTIYYRSDDLKISGLLFRPAVIDKKNVNFKKGIVIARGYYPAQSYYPGLGTFATGEKLAREGYTVIIPDYRGYYKSEGQNSYPYPGESIDIINAAVSLKNQFKLNNIYCIGYSWGGGIAATAAEISSIFDKLVLYYPQLGGVEINEREFQMLKSQLNLTGKQIMDFFYSKSPLYNCILLRIPTLVFHGRPDKVVKLEQSLKLQELMEKQSKQFELIIYDDEPHAFADGPDNKSWKKLLLFLKQ